MKTLFWFFLGIVIGFFISKEYWYKQGATDTALMYEDFSQGVEKNQNGTIDFDKYFKKLQENKSLLKKINSELE